MEEKVKTFVEEYNKRMDWNKDIIGRFGKEFVPVRTKDFIKEYLSTKKIDEEGYDLENAKLYTYEHDGVQEMQVFSNTTYGTVYFWVKPNETEEEYKERKTNRVREEAMKKLYEIATEITKLTHEKTEFAAIRDGLNF